MMATNVATGAGNRRRKPHPPRDLGRVDHAADSSAGQCRADRARPDPRADGHRGGELRQGAEEASEAVRPHHPRARRQPLPIHRRALRPDEGSLDHVLPRSRGGKNAWENLVWSGKDVNARKGNRLPHEAGLKLLTCHARRRNCRPSAVIRNAHGVAEWRLFLQ